MGALRVSAQITGDDVDMQMAVDGSTGSDGGIAHGALLSDFATAAVTGDDALLETTRTRIREELGAEQLVDAAALVAHYEKADRIADATGIPSDTPMQLMTADLRQQLGLERFTSAQNTSRPGLAKLALGRVLRGIAIPLLRRAARRRAAV